MQNEAGPSSSSSSSSATRDDDNPKIYWDETLEKIVGTDKQPLNPNAFAFTSESAAIYFISGMPRVSLLLIEFLGRLNERRPRHIDVANNAHDKGSALFWERREPYDLAADYFTQAVFGAPPNSFELARAHANRAGCFSHMMAFKKEGYDDCVLAMRFNFPLLFKILYRKYILAPDVQSKEKTLHEIEKAIEQKKFTDDQLELVDLEVLRAQVKAMKNLKDASDAGPSRTEPQFKNKKINEKFDGYVGRYVVAGEAIKKNQAIYREKAYAFVPVYADYKEDTILYHCQNCAKTNCIPFPCYGCVRASYCGIQCLEEHENIHKYECVGYQRNFWMRIGIAQLAFRCFIVGFADSIEKMDERVQEPEELFENLMKITDPNFVYGDVLRLITNFDKMDSVCVLNYAVTAELLAVYLDTYTDFFKKMPAKCKYIMPNVVNWKEYAKIVLMRHMGQLVCNGHAISDIEIMPNSEEDYSYRNTRRGYSARINIKDFPLVVDQGRIFTAIFPKISMLNHSCDPNIRNHFDGPFLTIHASQNIAENEQIFNCYGQHYKLVHGQDRRSNLLQQYYFECECEKCESLDSTYDTFFEYKCPTCSSDISADLFTDSWWNSIQQKGEKTKDAIRGKCVCKHCGTPLPFNPKLFENFMTKVVTGPNQNYSFYRPTICTKMAAELYMSMSKCLGKYHELRTIMAAKLLHYNMENDYEELFSKLAYVAMDYYVSTRERYGKYSLDTVLTIPYALYVLHMAKNLKNPDADTKKDIEQMRKVLKPSIMLKSISILSKDMQTIFKQAFEDVDRTAEKVHKIEDPFARMKLITKRRATKHAIDLSPIDEDPDAID